MTFFFPLNKYKILSRFFYNANYSETIETTKLLPLLKKRLTFKTKGKYF